MFWPIRTVIGFTVVSLAYFHYNGEVLDEKLIVSTKYGQIQGKAAYSRSGREYYQFLGVPFAKPPVDDLRFELPQPPEKWDGTRLATSYGPVCLQINYFLKSLIGEESCLYLNIFTPQLKGNELLPVIFYLHGGLFHFGNSRTYGPPYMMDEDVIFITSSYRLGALGFLNSGDGVIKGNMGLYDQLMALKFVQENIHNFGGDTTRVTILGASAGGTCAHLHMLSPLSKGLYSRVIAQSGNALNPWVIKTQPRKQALRFASKFNCTQGSSKWSMVNCLKALDAKDIVEAHREALDLLQDPLSMFGPTLEIGPDAFLSQMPIDLIMEGKGHSVPFINGVNENEGVIFAAPMIKNKTLQNELNQNWRKWLPQLINLEHTPVNVEISKRILQFYFSSIDFDKNQDFIHMGNLDNISDFLSDRLFFEGVHKYAKIIQGMDQNVPLYLYYYKYKGEFNVARIIFELTQVLPLTADLALTSGMRWISKIILGREGKHYGASHSDELALLFKLPFSPMINNGTDDYETSRQLIKTWVHFAKYGTPPVINGVKWRPVQKGDSNEELSYLSVDKDWEMVQEPFADRMRFWESLNQIDNTI